MIKRSLIVVTSQINAHVGYIDPQWKSCKGNHNLQLKSHTCSLDPQCEFCLVKPILICNGNLW
jgi:hypothetical protein